MQFLILIALIPSLIIALLVNKADKKEKEPTNELLKAFCIGILSIILTLVISFILNIPNMKINSNNLIEVAFSSFICISLIEELCKWGCTYLFLNKNKNFNYLFDGIVYAVFVSLGFATVENVLYAFTNGIATVLIRAVTTVPAHAFFAVFSGYYISLAKKEKLNSNIKLSRNYISLSIIIPILLHGFYDFCLLSQNYLFFIIFIIFIVSLYVISIHRIKTMMQMEEAFSLNKRNDK